MKVVLFCGGMGPRIREYSEAVPKPMIPLAASPSFRIGGARAWLLTAGNPLMESGYVKLLLPPWESKGTLES